MVRVGHKIIGIGIWPFERPCPPFLYLVSCPGRRDVAGKWEDESKVKDRKGTKIGNMTYGEGDVVK